MKMFAMKYVSGNKDKLQNFVCILTKICCSIFRQIPNEVYRPPVEVYRSGCREIKKGYQRTNSPRYYISIPEGDEDGTTSEIEEPRVVVQMDTESPAIYQKSCLDHYFEKPIQVSYKFLSNKIF
jgi:hypothetical protein